MIRLTSGELASVSSPATAGSWTHVAATYDGKVAILYLDGQEAARTEAEGTLVRGAGPLLIGSDVDGRRTGGLIDSAWFNTVRMALSSSQTRMVAAIRLLPATGATARGIWCVPARNHIR